MFNFSVKTTLSNKFKVLLFNYFLTILLIVVSVISLNATNYYVSSSGSDSNSGTSESQPWRSLTKVNSFTPKPGDQILFKRGDEWIGTITVNGSGTSSSRIIYGAYGTGEKPKIYGSEKITGWTKHSGNIYKASFGTPINQLFLNDSRMKAARFPNSGYALISSTSSPTTFTCDALNSSINYKGAIWTGRTIAYSTVTLDVVSSSGKTLTLSSAPYEKIGAKEGFILVNKLEFLDLAGEWYYDEPTKTVYFWTPNGDSPNNYSVRGTVLDNGVSTIDKQYITIKDLEILQFKGNGIYVSGSNVMVDNNTVSHPDSKGIYVAYGSNNIISNNSISGANHVGIYAYSTNSTYSDNDINDTFLFGNIGLTGCGSWFMGSGIFIEGNGNLIKYNRVINSGYNGIQFTQRNTVEFNYVKNALLTKDDGGAIYTASFNSYPNARTAGSIIRNNIVDGSWGTLDGWATWVYRGGHGIFLDENAGGVTVENNTVANCTGAAMFFHKSFDETVRNNTIINARKGISIKVDLGGSKFTNNIVYALKRDIDNTGIEVLVSKYQSNVTIDYNKYINHYNSSYIFNLELTNNHTFNEWKSITKQDGNSTIDISPLGTGETEELFYNDTKQTKTINLGNTVYKDLDGQQVPQSLILTPFTSKILIKTKTVVAGDNTAPIISSFSIPATSTSLIVPINSFSANDNTGVTGFKITVSSDAPNANDSGWSTIIPSSYTFESEGTKTLYAWAKDASGNVSKSISDQVVISIYDAGSGVNGNTEVPVLVSTSPYRRATPVTFNNAAVIKSISIYHNGGSGNVLMGVYNNQTGAPSTQLGITSSTAINTSEGWQTVSLINPVAINAGQTIWLSWVFENNPGIRYAEGTPGRAQSDQSWTGGMPTDFGVSNFSDYTYAIYCTSDEPSLEVSNTSILLNEKAGAIATFDILSNLNWSVSENADWLNVSKLTGSNNGIITVTTTSANVDLVPRTAVLTVVSQTGTSQTITITQKNQTLQSNTQGTLEVFASSSTTANQRAIPVTFNEEGEINSISIYHNGGTGRLLLGVYSDKDDSPASQLGISPKTVINASAGWQTVNLENAVPVVSGQKVWLSWVFENNPGIRYSIGTPGRAESSATWSTAMQTTFGASTFGEYNYSIFCSYTPGITSGLLGNTEVFNSISIAPNRRAISFTAEETGSIESISIYHDGGTGNVLLGVYSDDNGSPSYQLGVSSSTTINSTPGWQTVLLPSALPVTAGQTIWLAWVFQNNPGIRYTVSSNGRVQSIDSWSEGMPTNFGSFTTSNYEYSIYCTIKPSLTSIAGNNEVYEQSSIETFMRASSVTFDEGGTINSISIYHDGGTGNVLLGVYSDQSGSPASRLGVTASTAINSKEGWQTVSLQNPVTVYSGQTIWLSWVFQDHPGVRYSIGKPGRAQSTGTWPAGMPTNFGSSSFSDYNYSIYCSFIPNKPILKGAEIPEFVDSDPVITPDATFIEPKPNTKVNSFNEKNMTQFNDFDFKMYPNPAKSHVNIDFVFFPETGTTIEIIDGFGRIIEKKPAESTSNRIETNQLTRGMYFIKVINNQNYLVKKLIIE